MFLFILFSFISIIGLNDFHPEESYIILIFYNKNREDGMVIFSHDLVEYGITNGSRYHSTEVNFLFFSFMQPVCQYSYYQQKHLNLAFSLIAIK